jgi:hypothetical protein
MKKLILNESDKKAIISAKEKVIVESFAKTFNKIKRVDEAEITEDDEDDEDDRDVIVRWCDICDTYTEYSDDTPYGTCQCS